VQQPDRHNDDEASQKQIDRSPDFPARIIASHRRNLVMATYQRVEVFLNIASISSSSGVRCPKALLTHCGEPLTLPHDLVEGCAPECHCRGSQADTSLKSTDVRFVPKADIASL
jgi:hypothetical protein